MSAKRKGVTKTTGEADVPTTATVAETAAKAARAAADNAQRLVGEAKALLERIEQQRREDIAQFGSNVAMVKHDIDDRVRKINRDLVDECTRIHQRIDILAKSAWSRRIRDAWRSVFG